MKHALYYLFLGAPSRSADLQYIYLATVAQLYRLCLKHWYH